VLDLLVAELRGGEPHGIRSLAGMLRLDYALETPLLPRRDDLRQPGILYLLLYNTTKRVTVTAYPLEVGGARLIVGGDDPATVTAIVEWARALWEDSTGQLA
jgi:hypothetical protein